MRPCALNHYYYYRVATALNRALAAAPMAMARLTGSAVPRGKTWVISSRVVCARYLSSRPKEAWLKSQGRRGHL